MIRSRAASLGDTADVAGPALVKSKPIIEQTGQLARTAKPVVNNLADLTTSLRDTGGIEQLMDWIYYQVAAINGYDEDGHYLRAGLLLNQCSAYSITFAAACSATARRRSAGCRSGSRPPGCRRRPAST